MEEVNPDSGKAERSKSTGHLVITLPKAKNVIIRPKTNLEDEKKINKIPAVESEKSKSSTTFLDVSNPNEDMDFSRIVVPQQNDFDDLPNLESIDDDEADEVVD